MKSKQILSAVFAMLVLMLFAGCQSTGSKSSSSQPASSSQSDSRVGGY